MISPARTRCREAASRILRAASGVVPLAQMADAMEVSSSAVEHWADVRHDAAITLGDVIALPSRAAEAVLVAALAQVQAPRATVPVDLAVMSAGAEGGDVQRVAFEAAPGGYDLAELKRMHREAIEAAAAYERLVANISARIAEQG